MKKFLFIVSHLESGSHELLKILNNDPKIDIQNIGATYAHPSDLDLLSGLGHKLNTVAAIYGDHLLFNMNFSYKPFYENCKFIYVIREPKSTLNRILKHTPYPSSICRYYCFRLRRICEMAKRTPGAVFLTWEDMSSGRCFPWIEEYLKLTQPLEIPDTFDNSFEDRMPLELTDKVQESFEKYLYYLRQLDLVQQSF